MLKGFRFTNQLANAEVDARIHQEFLNKNDGIFYGMELSKTNNSITISEGLCEISGRPIAVINNEIINVSSENLYCVLILEIDLSKESTMENFEQACFKLLTSTTEYSKVTQQDINKYGGTNKIYQLEFARFRSGTNGITEFKDTRKFLNFSGIYSQVNARCQEIINEIKTELLNVENESRCFLKATQLTNENLNTYKNEGFFYTAGGNTVTNKPNNVDFFGMFVMKTANALVTQLMVSINKIYLRALEGSSWSNWIDITDTSDFLSKSKGGTISKKTIFNNGLEGDLTGNCTGNAGTATKLKTARKISVQGAVKGSGNFDGNADITINVTQNNIAVLSGQLDLKAASTDGSYSPSFNNVLIDFPSGFSKDNCVVISSAMQLTDYTGYTFDCAIWDDSRTWLRGGYPSMVTFDYKNNGKINYTIVNPTSQVRTCKYKIVLMKIS